MIHKSEKNNLKGGLPPNLKATLDYPEHIFEVTLKQSVYHLFLKTTMINLS